MLKNVKLYYTFIGKIFKVFEQRNGLVRFVYYKQNSGGRMTDVLVLQSAEMG